MQYILATLASVWSVTRLFLPPARRLLVEVESLPSCRSSMQDGRPRATRFLLMGLGWQKGGERVRGVGVAELGSSSRSQPKHDGVLQTQNKLKQRLIRYFPALTLATTPISPPLLSKTPLPFQKETPILPYAAGLTTTLPPAPATTAAPPTNAPNCPALHLSPNGAHST